MYKRRYRINEIVTFTHTHTVIHDHAHNHYLSDDVHGHHHSVKELEKAL